MSLNECAKEGIDVFAQTILRIQNTSLRMMASLIWHSGVSAQISRILSSLATVRLYYVSYIIKTFCFFAYWKDRRKRCNS